MNLKEYYGFHDKSDKLLVKTILSFFEPYYIDDNDVEMYEFNRVMFVLDRNEMMDYSNYHLCYDSNEYLLARVSSITSNYVSLEVLDLNIKLTSEVFYPFNQNLKENRLLTFMPVIYLTKGCANNNDLEGLENKELNLVNLKGKVISEVVSLNRLTKKEMFIYEIKVKNSKFKVLAKEKLDLKGNVEVEGYLSGIVFDSYQGQNRTLEINKYQATSLDDLYALMSRSWSKESCYKHLKDEYDNKHRSFAQCAPSSLIVNDLLGGEIYYVEGSFNRHYFNVVNGEIIDLCAEDYRRIGVNFDYDKYKRFQVSKSELLSHDDVKNRYKVLSEKMIENAN